MNRQAKHQNLLERISKLQDTNTKKSFLQDVQRLCELDSNQSLPGITASVWIDKLTELSDEQLYKYMSKYQKDMLNPLYLKK